VGFTVCLLCLVRCGRTGYRMPEELANASLLQNTAI
jgi:hypothetical protein